MLGRIVISLVVISVVDSLRVTQIYPWYQVSDEVSSNAHQLGKGEDGSDLNWIRNKTHPNVDMNAGYHIPPVHPKAPHAQRQGLGIPYYPEQLQTQRMAQYPYAYPSQQWGHTPPRNVIPYPTQSSQQWLTTKNPHVLPSQPWTQSTSRQVQHPEQPPSHWVPTISPYVNPSQSWTQGTVRNPTQVTTKSWYVYPSQPWAQSTSRKVNYPTQNPTQWVTTRSPNVYPSYPWTQGTVRNPTQVTTKPSYVYPSQPWAQPTSRKVNYPTQNPTQWVTTRSPNLYPSYPWTQGTVRNPTQLTTKSSYVYPSQPWAQSTSGKVNYPTQNRTQWVTTRSPNVYPSYPWTQGTVRNPTQVTTKLSYVYPSEPWAQSTSRKVNYPTQNPTQWVTTRSPNLYPSYPWTQGTVRNPTQLTTKSSYVYPSQPWAQSTSRKVNYPTQNPTQWVTTRSPNVYPSQQWKQPTAGKSRYSTHLPTQSQTSQNSTQLTTPRYSKYSTQPPAQRVTPGFTYARSWLSSTQQAKGKRKYPKQKWTHPTPSRHSYVRPTDSSRRSSIQSFVKTTTPPSNRKRATYPMQPYKRLTTQRRGKYPAQLSTHSMLSSNSQVTARRMTRKPRIKVIQRRVYKPTPRRPLPYRPTLPHYLNPRVAVRTPMNRRTVRRHGR